MKEYYLVTTDHLESSIWFRDDSDFKVAMNYVAVQAALCPDVDVLAFILMSNHVHFVLNGREDDVLFFVNQFKRRYSAYYRKRYDVKEFLRGNKVDLRIVPFEDDSLERAIAYVQMNCVAASICSHPTQYPWGTGNIFFSQIAPPSTRLVDISKRARRRLLHSACLCLPANWLISKEGFILPQSYADIQTVEFLYRNPKRMNYFLANSSKARKRIQTIDDNLPSFRDQTIVNALPDLCRSLFNKNSFKELKEDEQAEFVQQIRYRFSADANQIARTCEIPYDRAACLLQSFH